MAGPVHGGSPDQDGRVRITVRAGIPLHARAGGPPPTGAFYPHDDVGTGRKAPMGGASTHEREDTTMHGHTTSDLARRSTADLHGLLRAAFSAIATSAPDSPDRRAAFAAIAAIRRELARRGSQPHPGP